MPDIHWGYGFPIGGCADHPNEGGVILPGRGRLRPRALEVGAHQADAAIDVVADPRPGRSPRLSFRVGRANTADGETVPPIEWSCTVA